MANREILFRRVHRDRRNGQSRENGQIKFTDWGFPNGVFEGPSHISGWDTVCDEQFTGLTDRNGAKIFEGDVISHIGQRIGVVKYYPEIGVFGFTDKAHSENESDAWFFYDCNPMLFEILGNIHDQPELLTLNQESK